MTRVVVGQLVEGDHAGVVLAVHVAPGHPLLRALLDDLSVPFVALPAERRDPVQMRLVLLADLVDALHELRELAELRPLVVGLGDRDLNVY